MLKIPSQGNI